MGYLIDITGHTNMHIDSDCTPRIGELVEIMPDTFEGQEEKISYRVSDVRFSLGRGYIKGLPLVTLESE